MDKLVREMSLKTDVFLTHDWGKEQANHRRVAEINAALEKKGIITWFDEVRSKFYVFIYFYVRECIKYHSIMNDENSLHAYRRTRRVPLL